MYVLRYEFSKFPSIKSTSDVLLPNMSMRVLCSVPIMPPLFPNVSNSISSCACRWFGNVLTNFKQLITITNTTITNTFNNGPPRPSLMKMDMMLTAPHSPPYWKTHVEQKNVTFPHRKLKNCKQHCRRHYHNNKNNVYDEEFSIRMACSAGIKEISESY